MKKTLREIPEEKIEIPPEADSYAIDGWDAENNQQQAYIQNINRHLAKTVDTETDAQKGEKEENKENHGIIGCGIYYPWVTQKDQWAEALQKAEAATGYRASWHWNMERGETEEIIDWETGEKKPKEQGKKIPKPEGWYDKITEPYRKAYMERMPGMPESGRKSPERKRWESERKRRFEETLKRQQKMFAELLRGK